MKSNKKTLQKIAYYFGIASFIASVVCMILIYLWIDDLGWEHTISASLMATSVFFASVGFVLVTIGKCNLPNLKVGDTDS